MMFPAFVSKMSHSWSDFVSRKTYICIIFCNCNKNKQFVVVVVIFDVFVFVVSVVWSGVRSWGNDSKLWGHEAKLYDVWFSDPLPMGSQAGNLSRLFGESPQRQSESTPLSFSLSLLSLYLRFGLVSGVKS